MKALIVDDASMPRKIVKSYLERGGYEVFEAKDGVEGFEIASIQKPDIIISDILMPRMDGFNLLRKIRKDEALKHTFFIFYSATYTKEKEIEFGISIGADAFIIKPAKPDLFLNELQGALDKAKDREKAPVPPSDEEFFKKYSSIITDKLEKKIKEIEEDKIRFRATFEQTAVGIAHVAPDGRWLLVNQRLCDIVGYTNSELMKKTFQDITYPDDLEADLEYVRQMLANEIQTYSLEKRYIRKDGSVIWINLIVALVRDSSGKPQYFISVVEDINRRKLKEIENDRLNRENQLLKTIAIAIYQAEDLNSAIESVLSDVCESTGWVYAESWIPDNSGEALEYCRGFYREERHIRFMEESKGFKFKQGIGLPGMIWLTKKAEWLKDVSALDASVFPRSKLAMDAGLKASLGIPIIAGDKILAILIFFMAEAGEKDEEQVRLISAVALQLGAIIQKKKSDEEKKRLEKQVEHMQKIETIGQLTGGIAHDFNNLLTAIILSGNMLKRKLENNPELIPFLQQILSTADRAANLTKSLLTFSRRQVIDKKPVSLNDIIKNVEKLLARIIGEDIELRIKLSERDVVLMADSGQIEQVLMNLATNARDAMPNGGELTIDARLINLDEEYVKVHAFGKAGPYALINVTDTGAGMDEATQGKIFEPFFTTKEAGKGTGLGLSIVYGIVKQHDGYINVYSEPGRGTSFKIYLPIIESEVEAAKTMEIIPPRGGSETILIAEDEARLRELAKSLLTDYGYKVIEAVDGEDAVKRFNENMDKIQLAILDVIMPKKNGKDVYNEIMKTKPYIKSLFVSGYNEEVIHKKGILEEGLNFISKPFAPSAFLRKVREVLDK